MKLHRNHGMDKVRYWHEVAGNNFRLTNLQASLGCAQFEQLDRISTARREMDRLYRLHLDNIEGITCQIYDSDVVPVVWAIAVKLSLREFSQGRDKVMSEMLEAGIETRPGFYAASLMTHIYGENMNPLPHCLELSQQIISLPSSPTLNAEDISYVCNTLIGLRK